MGEDSNCWPRMAGMVPDLDDEVLHLLADMLKVQLALLIIEDACLPSKSKARKIA